MATAQELITKAKTFKPSEVSYKAPRISKKGGKTIPLTLNGHNLVLQVPLMFTWGVNEWDDDTGSYKKYDMNLQFDESPSGSEAMFLKGMKELQEKVLNDAVTKYSKEWFGKSKMSREVAEALMYPILKHPKDKQTGESDHSRPPSMKVKIPCWDSEFKVELYDMNKNPLYLPNNEEFSDKSPVELIPSRSHVKGLIECNGIWFAGGKFGVTWKLVQAQVRPPVRIQGFCILEDSDDEEIEENLAMQEAVELGATSGQLSSDEEEEVPKPKKGKRKKKKKVVKKKD